MKQRIEFIDLAKGISIILIVLLHTVPIHVFDLRFISVPLFFIISGLFFKDYGSALNFLKKKTNSLLIPFIFFYLISYALFYIIKIYAPHLPVANANGILDVFRQYNLFNGPIWFLLCLFWINIYFWLISHFCHREIYKAFVVVTVGVVGAILLRRGIFLPMYLDVAMRALPIFYIGYILKKTPILYPNGYDRYNLMFSAILIIITTVAYIFTNPTMPFESTTLRGGVLGYITSTMSVLAIFMLCKHIKRIPVISYFGRYSIIVLCTHHLTYRPILLCLTKISDNETLISWVTFILTMAVTYFIIPICIKYIPYVTAQKDVFKIQSK